ncbi:MAG: hypothetical protein L0H29_02715 [Sinobacteraceae bacterium]|nr:hypothetical protein [Nevskiaceae bacterium]
MSNAIILLRAIVTVAPAAFVLGSLFVVTGPATLWITAVFVCMVAIMLADSGPRRVAKTRLLHEKPRSRPSQPAATGQTPCNACEH